MKHIVAKFGTLALSAAIAVSGTACTTEQNSAPLGPVGANSESVYALSMITGANFLTAMKEPSSAPSAARLSFRSELREQPTESESEPATARPDAFGSQIPALNEYLNSFEGILSADELSPVLTAPTEEDGEYAEYDVKLTIALGDDFYVLYYNERSVKTESNAEEESPAQEPSEDEREESEEEKASEEQEEQEKKEKEKDREKEYRSQTEIKLEGVLLVGSERFDITGKREIEQKGDKYESEIEFTTKSRENPLNYVTVKQSVETETDEQEIQYEYSVYREGKRISNTKIQWETDEEDGKTELTVQFKQDDGTLQETKFSLRFEENTVAVKVKSRNESDRFTIEIGETHYLYTYSNGFTEELPRES